MSSKKRKFDDRSKMKLSRKLTKLLRHNAVRRGLKVREDGYVHLTDIQKLDGMQAATEDVIREIVAEDNKQRFGLREENVGEKKESKEEKFELLIRANQGHTMRCVKESALLTPITDSSAVPCCIHGTNSNAWKIIKSSGLSRMKRNHIHMAAGEPGTNGVISGMRRSCDVIIHIDVDAAMKDGISFYLSENNVILSPGPIPPQFFSKVIHRKK
eukprot:g5370.t1